MSNKNIIIEEEYTPIGCSLYQAVYVEIKRMEPELWALVDDDIPFKHPCLRVRGV